jgi:hypothetical protein
VAHHPTKQDSVTGVQPNNPKKEYHHDFEARNGARRHYFDSITDQQLCCSFIECIKPHSNLLLEGLHLWVC